MFKKSLLIVALLAASPALLAQSPAPAAGNAPAKKEIIGKILKIQQSGIELLARTLAEQPAAELMARAGPALAQRVPQDKQEAVAKDIQADAKKYIDETVPLVRDRALKLAPTTVGTLLEEKFSEEELKQVLAMMQSPVYVKFQSLGGDMQKVLTDKLVEETRGVVEPKVRAMEESIARRLGVTAGGGGGSGNAPAPKAAAPAKK
jgi:hypothetical protein